MYIYIGMLNNMQQMIKVLSKCVQRYSLHFDRVKKIFKYHSLKFWDMKHSILLKI